MCTLTIIPLRAPHTGFRVVTNRDESRGRPAALPPARRATPLGAACWPVDALAGGTWIGAGEHALVVSLLNGNPHPRPTLPRDLTSRGALIPQLLGAPDAASAIERLRAFDLDRFAPFRIVAVDPASVIDARWSRVDLEVTQRPLAPACFVSSGMGDHLVQPRLPLWEEFLATRGVTREMQDEFHAHLWPDRPEISVRMERAEARTVSTTSVEVAPGADGRARVAMRYTADSVDETIDLAPDAAPPVEHVRLARRPAATAARRR